MLVGVVNQKGGVGKSTLAVHLLGALAERGSQNLVLVDCDPQRSATQYAADAVPAARVEAAENTDDLVDLLQELTDQDVDAVVDVAGTVSDIHRAATLVCDRIVIPTGTGILDLRSLQAAAKMIQQARQIRGDGRPAACCVLNRCQPGTKHEAEVREAIGDLQLSVASQTLGQRVAFRDAAASGCLVWDLGAAAETAAAEMRTLVASILD